MATTTVSLDQFARRIAQQQAELEALRREYEARQSQLAELTSRKQDLQAQLVRVEGQIEALTGGEAPQPTSASAPKPKKPAAAPPSKAATPVSLPQILVTLVSEAGRPITVKELADALKSRKYPTASQNFTNVVQTRVGELVKKGAIQWAKDGSGVVAAASANGAKPAPKGTAAPRNAPVSAPKRKGKQPALRVVLTQLLQASKLPLGGTELSQLAKSQGYRSDSKNFANVVWVMLRKMDNVEHVPGKGYRLKKSR